MSAYKQPKTDVLKRDTQSTTQLDKRLQIFTKQTNKQNISTHVESL